MPQKKEFHDRIARITDHHSKQRPRRLSQTKRIARGLFMPIAIWFGMRVTWWLMYILCILIILSFNDDPMKLIDGLLNSSEDTIIAIILLMLLAPFIVHLIHPLLWILTVPFFILSAIILVVRIFTGSVRIGGHVGDDGSSVSSPDWDDFGSGFSDGGGASGGWGDGGGD
ncbi:MAG: hypothetical protein AAGJ34_04280 [Pseudomonadota bacterium]